MVVIVEPLFLGILTSALEGNIEVAAGSFFQNEARCMKRDLKSHKLLDFNKVFASYADSRNLEIRRFLFYLSAS